MVNMAKTKYEEYQSAIDELTARQIAGGKGWNPGFQLMVDRLAKARDALTAEEAGEPA
jgi:hypothetical protein